MKIDRKTVDQNIDIKHGKIEMTHGSGGRAMASLIDEMFTQPFSNPLLEQKNDQAVFPVEAGRMVMSTDSFVISPLFFPGGNIGSLAIHGTVNDVAMSGAVPKYISVGFILEEGFPLIDLEKITISMADAAKEAGVQIITGDTKVVEKGKADGVFINTAGVGILSENLHISGDNAQVGDKIIVSGTIGDHGVAIMSKRENLMFESEIISDSASLNGMVAKMVEAVPNIHVLRDPTRGGMSATLNEIAHQSKVGIRLFENDIPVQLAVISACEILGLDPLNVANEGKLIAICSPDKADELLHIMTQHPNGKNASIIGEVVEDTHYFVEMETSFGGRRIVDWLSGEQLPRIC